MFLDRRYCASGKDAMHAERPLGAVCQPFREPDKHDQWHHENGGQACGYEQEKYPVLPCMFMRLLQMTGHQGVVAPIRLPGDVEHIAEDGD